MDSLYRMIITAVDYVALKSNIHVFVFFFRMGYYLQLYFIWCLFLCGGIAQYYDVRNISANYSALV